MVAGTLGAAALAIGTGFVIALGRAHWLSVRRLESWFAIALIGFGLWFMWRSWNRRHLPLMESSSPSRSAALEPLPIRSTRPVPKKKPSPSDPLILLVDDVADNIDVYTQFFLHRGWRTATASNGPEGLTSAAGLRPDVIVLDLGMPGMDGWEVARRLKADAVTRSIPDHRPDGTCPRRFAAPRPRSRSRRVPDEAVPSSGPGGSDQEASAAEIAEGGALAVSGRLFRAGVLSHRMARATMFG